MPYFKFKQPILQLDKNKGGYNYLVISSAIVEQFEKKRHTRLKCIIEQKVSLSCGLNHLGDGNYYIIIANRFLKTLQKEVGEVVCFEITEDPNPLGVDIPEVLQALLEQDTELNQLFLTITDGKKRSLIHAINKMKDIDKQVDFIISFLNGKETMYKRQKQL